MVLDIPQALTHFAKLLKAVGLDLHLILPASETFRAAVALTPLDTEAERGMRASTNAYGFTKYKKTIVRSLCNVKS
jgi:hypothetical protein